MDYFQTLTPQGDGNSHLQHRMLQWAVLSNPYPARGRKQSFPGQRGRLLAFKPLPRKGTETKFRATDKSYRHLSNPYPARGRKHKKNKRRRDLTDFQTLTPQGDGNRPSNYPRFTFGFTFKPLPRKGTETGGIIGGLLNESSRLSNPYPARGRKLQCSMGPQPEIV